MKTLFLSTSIKGICLTEKDELVGLHSKVLMTVVHQRNLEQGHLSTPKEFHPKWFFQRKFLSALERLRSH